MSQSMNRSCCSSKLLKCSSMPTHSLRSKSTSPKSKAKRDAGHLTDEQVLAQFSRWRGAKEKLDRAASRMEHSARPNSYPSGWGSEALNRTATPETVDDALQLMHKLRRAGIRAHFWI